MAARLPDFGGAAGFFLQIVQSPRTVSIFYDTGQGQGWQRIIPVTDRQHLPSHVRQWWGDSRGRWEGNTLVVDVTNFTAKTDFQGSGENLHLIERWTRVDAKTLEYVVAIDIQRHGQDRGPSSKNCRSRATRRTGSIRSPGVTRGTTEWSGGSQARAPRRRRSPRGAGPIRPHCVAPDVEDLK